MKFTDAMIMAGLAPEPPKETEEARKRNDESARAFRFLNDFKKRASTKKRDRREAAESAEKKQGLDELMARQQARIAEAKISSAQAELAAAQRARPRPGLTPDE